MKTIQKSAVLRYCTFFIFYQITKKQFLHFTSNFINKNSTIYFFTRNPIPFFIKSCSYKWLLFWSFLNLTFCNAFSQKYFQQEVNYDIHVTLDDVNHELNAFESVEYINNSPDTLYFLYFHLWPNAYSNNSTPLAKQLFQLKGKHELFNDPELKGYVDSLDFKTNNRNLKWNFLPGQPDICQIFLDIPLKKGDTVVITTPFHVKIPKGITSRLGHIGESYQISQWFPKPAVYDQSGWNQMSYLDQGEFFSEFGNFDVWITLPENYIVGATGNLMDSLENKWYDELAADTAWLSKTNLEDHSFPESSLKMKKIHFNAKQVHDFAWFADKRFHILKGKVKLPESGRKITTTVMFTNMQTEFWKNALNYVNDAIIYFSEHIADYPYESFTAVQSALSAGLGMEYPGITVIGLTDDAYSLDEVITHEICHNWFYGALGFNERMYPFLDEGLTSAYTERYMVKKYPEKKLWEVFLKKKKLANFLHFDNIPLQRLQELEWLIQARSNLEQPLNLPATEYDNINYTVMLYNKASESFNYLRAYLGDSLFDSTVHRFYKKWIFKHPMPDDLRYVFEIQTGKELNWFFDDLIGTTKRLDYKIARITNGQLLLKNVGELASPIVISGILGDSIVFEKWIDGFIGQKWVKIPKFNYSKIKIDPGHVMPEIIRLNNSIRKNGNFKKNDLASPQLFFSVEDPEKSAINYMPVANWTLENGFMAGFAIHNGFFLPKRIEYIFMPLYAFGNSNLAGFGRILYTFNPFEKFIRQATVSIEATQYGAPENQNYRKMKAGIDIYFRNSKRNSALNQKVSVDYFHVSNLYQIESNKKAKMSSYLQFGYRLERKGFINPYRLQTILESGNLYQKASVEFNYKFSYYGPINGLDIRFFAGTMLKNNSNIPFYSFSTSGRSGREQYLYQGSFPDRFAVFSSGFWSRQMALTEGAMITPVNESIGYSPWVVSGTFTSTLPGKLSRLPVKPFVNLLLCQQSFIKGNISPLYFESGIKVGFWDFFEIYFPLFVSQNIESVNGLIKNRIRFVFSLDAFNRTGLKSRSGN